MMAEFLVISIIIAALLNIKAFDSQALVVSSLFGLIIWFLRGFEWFLVMFIFLAVGVSATFFNIKSRSSRNSILQFAAKIPALFDFSTTPIEKHTSRGVDNVLSNGLVAFMAAVFSFPYIYLGSVSAALADTLSSEIGVLSKKRPYLITHMRTQVPRGTNGGISILGCLASAIGAIIIATLAYFLFLKSMVLFWAVFAGGFTGSFVDSFLGAWLENKKVITNGSVNFVTTLFGGLLTAFIMAVL